MHGPRLVPTLSVSSPTFSGLATVSYDIDPIKILIQDKKSTSVEYSPVDDILEEPFVASEIADTAGDTKSDEGAQEYIAGCITRKFGLPSAGLTGWTALQSHGGLTGASEETLSEVKLMDKAFNAVHGAGANLNDKIQKDPIL